MLRFGARLQRVQVQLSRTRPIAIKDRHAFKTELDDEAKRAMFPGNYRAQARA